MVRNIPCRYTFNEIKQDFDKNHKNHYNEIRLPAGDQEVKTNRSFCFINMRHVLYVYDFIRDKQNYLWPMYQSDKQIDFCFANEQPILNKNDNDANTTEQDKLDLKQIYDRIDDTKIPLENFTGMQPNSKPKYNGLRKQKKKEHSMRSGNKDECGTPNKMGFVNNFSNGNFGNPQQIM